MVEPLLARRIAKRQDVSRLSEEGVFHGVFEQP
jgi:hypothetical protein